jgi:hypothetical protein
VPPQSPSPLLRFECWPSLRPYVSGPDNTGSVLLSASVVDTTPGSAYSASTDGSLFHVTAQLDGHTIASNIPLSVGTPTATESPLFDWKKAAIAPRRDAYNLSCSATAAKSGKVFHSTAQVFYLPPAPSDVGGVVQTDGRTGGLLAGKTKSKVFPFGFYTAFGGYLDSNLTVLDEIKKQGWVV